MRNNLGPIREDVSVVWDLAPHDISIFNYLMGSAPDAVSAVGSSFLKTDRSDVAFLTLFYREGVVGNIQVSWLDSDKVREVVVVGDRKRVVFDDLDLRESVRIFEKGVSVEKGIDSFGEFHYLLRDGDIISPKVEMIEPLKNVCNSFVNAVKTHTQPLSDGKCGMDVVRTIEAANKSIIENGRKIDV
jgi:predicted dehydrogenase